jgi:hypothetical protein
MLHGGRESCHVALISSSHRMGVDAFLDSRLKEHEVSDE